MFTRLGLTAFGGPAAHIAMFEQEAVQRRRWLDRRSFLDLLGATQLIPGPNSTEMAIHLGLRRAGVPGLLVAGACFVGPAVLLSLLLGRAYVAGAGVPRFDALLRGVQPVAWALIVAAVGRLGPIAVRNVRSGVIAAATGAAAWGGLHPLTCLLGAGVVGVVVSLPPRDSAAAAGSPPAAMPFALAAAASMGGATGASVPLASLAIAFLQIGAVLYGSGYVLIAFLERVFVHQHGWLSGAQLVDAVAVGQITPGPVLSTAAFVGFLLGGWGGGLVAGAAIFAPSFLYVTALHRLLPRLRRKPLARAFLDGVNAGALALIVVVGIQLAGNALHGPSGLAIAAVALALRWRDLLPAPALVVGGALLGWLFF